MITTAYVTMLYNYNRWANERVLTTAEALSAAELDATPLEDQPSIRATLLHTLWAQWVWRSRWQGISPTTRLDPADFPDIAAIRTRWHAENEALAAQIATLNDEALLDDVSYTTTSGASVRTPLWQVLAHLANHSTHHRSEVAALLTALSHSPGDIDMIVFFRQ